MDIAKIDEEIENLISAIATGNNTVTKYLNERIDALDRQKSELNKKINEQEIKDYALYGRFTGMNIDDIDRILETQDFDELKNICNIFIKEITLTPSKEASVE